MGHFHAAILYSGIVFPATCYFAGIDGLHFSGVLDLWLVWSYPIRILVHFSFATTDAVQMYAIDFSRRSDSE